MKQMLIIPALTAIVVLGMAAPAYARGGDSTSSTDNHGDLAETAQTVDNNVSSDTESAASDSASHAKTLSERIEARTTELENELNEKKEAHKEKLAGRRLEQCQNRQANINSLLNKSVTIGRDRLARIQSIEDGVKAFYVNQHLSSAQYDATLQAVDEKQAAATAALNVIDAQPFDCSQVDGAKPSDTIKTTFALKRNALKDYRDSVQELIRVVRQAFVAKVQQVEAKQ